MLVFLLLCFFLTGVFVCADPAPVLEASHTLEGRLQQLQSSAPEGQALAPEVSGHWQKHLEGTERSEVTATGSRVAEAEEAPQSDSPASLMTPDSTPAPGAAGSPLHNHQDPAEGRR